MTTYQEDPFNNAPADNTPEPEPTNAPVAQAPTVVNRTSTGGDGKIVLTFKEAPGFDASWVVVHADSVDDADGILRDPKFKSLMDLAKEGAKYFRGGSTPSAGGGGGGGGQRAPQQAQEAPGGQKKFCSHGEMEYKSGTSKKTGKPYSLFSCTGPRNEQCDAQWPDK